MKTAFENVFCEMAAILSRGRCINTLRPRQNGRHFTDCIFKYVFLKENVRISLKISLKLVSMVQINIIPALVPIMAWRRPGDKPLSGPMMVNLLTHICVTLLQWLNTFHLHETHNRQPYLSVWVSFMSTKSSLSSTFVTCEICWLEYH